MSVRRQFLRVFAVAMLEMVVLGAAINGCKEEEPKPPVETSPATPKPTPGGSTTEAGTSDGGKEGGNTTADADAGGVCTDLAASTAVINEIAVQGDPPVGLGGALLDGTYNITDAQRFVGAAGVPGVTGASYQGSLRLSAGATVLERHVIFKNASGAASELVHKGSFIPGTGGNGTVSLTCPTLTQESVSYTVNGNNLIISNLVTKESLTYAKVQ